SPKASGSTGSPACLLRAINSFAARVADTGTRRAAPGMTAGAAAGARVRTPWAVAVEAVDVAVAGAAVANWVTLPGRGRAAAGHDSGSASAVASSSAEGLVMAVPAMDMVNSSLLRG
ncbi:MAG: hypothetical protein J2P33_17345, partial [Actinobacteria bacterium]|nr:hypothetical protein [Actinomycetota bacterium]